MCDNDEHSTYPIKVGGRFSDETAYVDPCLIELLSALNGSGFPTAASCCGHGEGLGNIVLEDGRELVIAPNWATARAIEAAYAAWAHVTLEETQYVCCCVAPGNQVRCSSCAEGRHGDCLAPEPAIGGAR